MPEDLAWIRPYPPLNSLHEVVSDLLTAEMTDSFI